MMEKGVWVLEMEILEGVPIVVDVYGDVNCCGSW